MNAGGPVSKEPSSRSATVAPRHHPFFYIGGVLLNAAVFSAVGPLVGGLVLATVTSALELSISGLFAGTLGNFAFFFVTVPTSYFIALPPAFVTGAIVAVASVWITSIRSLYAIAAIVGGTVSILFLARSDFLMRDADLASSLIGFAVSGSVAALVCTRLTRPFRFTVPADTKIPGKLMAKAK